MQLLSHGLTVAALGRPDLPQLQELYEKPEFRYVAVVIAVLFVIQQVTAVITHWIASKAVADKDDATLRNGFKLWLFHFLFTFVWGLALGLLVVFVPRNESWRLIIVGGGMLLLGILIIFLIPMKVYRIGFWRSLGLLLLSGLMQGVVVTALQMAAMYSTFTGPHLAAFRQLAEKNYEDQRRLAERLIGKEAPDEIDLLLDDALNPIGPRKSLAEREAAVKVIQSKLGERKRMLPPGDEAAAGKFQRQLERYMRLLGEVKAERAAGR